MIESFKNCHKIDLIREKYNKGVKMDAGNLLEDNIEIWNAL